MSRELVQQAIHRSWRLATGAYGSDYKPEYYYPKGGDEVVTVLEATLESLNQDRRILSQDVESNFCQEYGQKSLDVWHPEFKLWGIGFSADPYQAFFIPFDPDPVLIKKFGLASIHSCPRILELVKELALKHTALHHSTIDARALWARYGVEFTDIEDSILLNYAIDDTAGDNSVDDLSWFHTEEGGYKKREYEDNIPKTIHDLEWDVYGRRGCHDADIERRIYFTLKDIAIRENVWGNECAPGVRPKGYVGVLKAANMVGIQMTLNGAAMNRPHLEGLIKSEQEKLIPLTKELYERPEIRKCYELIRKQALEHPKDKKANSIVKLEDVQISKDWIPPILFYDICKFPTGKVTDKGKRQVEAEHIEKVKGKQPAHERLAEIYLSIKRIEKKLSTYLLPYVYPKMSGDDEDLPEAEKKAKIAAGKVDRFEYIKSDGLCHPLFNGHKARSGRGSAENPNFQNILNDILIKMSFWSRQWRVELPGTETAFKHGKLTAGDFAQHEVRMCAWLCRDKNMIANLEKGFHMINLALLEKLITPADVPTITKEQVDALENVVMLRYLLAVDKGKTLGSAYGEQVYTEYHYKELFKELGAEHKALFGEWKNKFKVRKTVAKESTFGPLYGMEEKTFSTIHEIPLSEAHELFENDRKTYPAKHAYLNEVKARAKVDGFVFSCFGKKRRLDYKTAIARGDKAKIAELDRQGGNTCVDVQTEILTTKGWRRYNQIEVGDTVLTKDPTTGNLEWQPILALHLFPDYNGDLVSFESNSFSALTTPDHRWLVDHKINVKNGPPGRKTKVRTQFVTSETISLYGDDRIHRTGVNVQTDWVEYSDTFLHVCGWVLTDGSLKMQLAEKEGPFPFACVYQSKVENFEAITACLKVEGCSGESREGRAGLHTWHIRRPLAYKLLELFPERQLTPAFITRLSARQALLLIQTMLRGDGHEDENGSTLTVGQHRENAADMFQMLCAQAGIATSKALMDWTKWPTVLKDGSKMVNIPNSKKAFLVHLHRRDKVQVTKAQQSILRNQQQLVWCITVSNSCFLVRREGQVYFTGNCIQGPSSDVVLLCMKKCMEIYKRNKMPVLPIGTIHDSMMNDCHPDVWLEQLKIQYDVMENFPTELLGSDHVRFKAEMEVGPNWGEMEAWDPLKS